MIADFWLGALVATSVALAIMVASAAAIVVALARWLSKFADVHLAKDKSGAVTVSAEIRK